MLVDMVSFTDVPVPAPLTNRERRARYADTHRTPFVAWDGEGLTRADGSHDYVMLSGMHANGEAVHLNDIEALSSERIFTALLKAKRRWPGSIFVIYGGSYDFNCWMRDLARDDVEKVYTQRSHSWRGFRLSWRRGKSFSIRTRVGNVTVYDVVAFFQCAFVKACDTYLGSRFVDRDMIVANKALRGAFTPADVPAVQRYNEAELTNLLLLMDELRERLYAVGLRPRRWDGPGAIASALLTREGVRDAMQAFPDPIAEIARYAYAGGRFEVLRFGHVPEQPAYEYDLNSAYPSALRSVPTLAGGAWRHTEGDPGSHGYALYRLRWEAFEESRPGPLFWRDERGAIYYPRTGRGWYWSPEYDAAKEWERRGYGRLVCEEAWRFYPATDARPFAFIDALYEERRALKAAGNGAHVGIKLGLNSLYGKLAQQVGAYQGPDGEWKVPPFHQLEWAGYVTAHCRASVFRATLDCPDDVIAFETDAVFSRVPLTVKLGKGLGEWEATPFEGLSYFQSGVYFGSHEGKVERTRGIDRGQLTLDQVVPYFERPDWRDRAAPAKLTRFVGAGVALKQDWSRWRRWEQVTKVVSLEPLGKRMHAPSCVCVRFQGDRFPSGMWHRTRCPLDNGYAPSHAHPIVWAVPGEAMHLLAEFRDEPTDWDAP